MLKWEELIVLAVECLTIADFDTIPVILHKYTIYTYGRINYGRNRNEVYAV